MSVTVDSSRQQFRLQKITDAIKAIDISKSLSEAAGVARQFVVDTVNDQLNLPREYVDQLFTLQSGIRGGEFFTSVVGRARPVQLRNYDPRQLTKTGKNGKPVNAGISIKVRRGGSAETLPGAFFYRIRSGKDDGGNGFAIAVRDKRGPGTGKGQPRVLYGPAPYSVMTRISPQALDLGADALVKSLEEQAQTFVNVADY